MNNSFSSKRRILVVDDDPLVGETVVMLLRIEGHVVDSTTSSVAALELFEPGKFDLVFTDHFMPAMKGDELAAAIKKRSPGQPVVMITAYPEKLQNRGNPVACIEACIGKPFEVAELRDAINRFALAASPQ